MEINDIVAVIVGILLVIYTVGGIAFHRWLMSQFYSVYMINKRNELFGSFFIAIFLACATVAFWYVTDAIVLIAGVILIWKRPGQKVPIIIIMIIVIAVMTFSGVAAKRSMSASEDSDVASVSYTHEGNDEQRMDDLEDLDYEDAATEEYYDESSDFAEENWSDEEMKPIEEEWSDRENDEVEEDWSDRENDEVEEDWENEENELEEDLDNNDDIFPLSSSSYLDESDLDGLSKEECRIARNEIYARHGRMFTDEALQSYFDSKDWYDGYIEPEDFDESVLNEYEISNRNLIVEYETEMGYR